MAPGSSGTSAGSAGSKASTRSSPRTGTPCARSRGPISTSTRSTGSVSSRTRRSPSRIRPTACVPRRRRDLRASRCRIRSPQRSRSTTPTSCSSPSRTFLCRSCSNGFDPRRRDSAPWSRRRARRLCAHDRLARRCRAAAESGRSRDADARDDASDSRRCREEELNADANLRHLRRWRARVRRAASYGGWATVLLRRIGRNANHAVGDDLATVEAVDGDGPRNNVAVPVERERAQDAVGDPRREQLLDDGRSRPIRARDRVEQDLCCLSRFWRAKAAGPAEDRKSTRLNSSHVKSSYAVFCWKKKKKVCTCVDDVHQQKIRNTTNPNWLSS